jgi:eukaryotic-like serine/threonine-protein kinase
MPLFDESLWSRLSPLLDQALGLEGKAREELVRSTREEDPALGEALAGHLGEHERAVASGFLAQPSSLTPVALEGRTLGAYELVERIGAGGMGTVWRARRSDGMFEGDVALKLLHPSLLEAHSTERFRSEGSILSRLAHPGIARLYDAGVSPAGQPFLVLELVDGVRIDRFADAHRLPVRARLELFLQIADAVAFAHSNLVVHRDLKPSNILVDRTGRTKLLDFGVATLVDQASGVALGLTVTTARALTPEYAAPEQLEGGAITTATDVYSLGVLLYELLTGEHPVASADSSPAELVRAITAGETQRMSERIRQTPANPGMAEPAASIGDDAVSRLEARGTTQEGLYRALAGDLDTIVAKALKRPVAERYPTVAALADDLRRHLQNLPVRARPDSLGYRLRKLAARHRVEVAAAGLVVVALLSATGISWRQARASAAERDRALEELSRAEITNDLSGFLISEANPDGQPMSKSDLLARAEAMIDGRFADNPALQAHMLVLLSSRYYEISDYPPWQRVLQRAYELARRTSDPRLRAVAACELAMAVTDEEPERAQALLAQANLELDAQDPAVAAAELARCRLDEAIVASWGGQFERAVAAAEESLRFEASRPGPSGRGDVALNTLGLAQGQLGRFEAANATFERLFALLAAERRTRTRLATTARHNWTLALVNAGQVRRALAESDTLVAITRELGGGPVSPYKLSSRASLLSYAGRHDEAIATAAESIRNTSGTMGSQVPFWIYCTAARVQAQAGRFDEADLALAEMDRAFEAIPSPPAGLLGMRELYRARATIDRDARAAAALARRAFELLEREKQPARDLLQALLIAARAENDLGNGTLAAVDAARALEMANAGLGGFVHSRELGLAELEAARAAAGAGNLPAARAGFERAVENLRDAVGADAPETLRAERQAAAAIGGSVG